MGGAWLKIPALAKREEEYRLKEVEVAEKQKQHELELTPADLARISMDKKNPGVAAVLSFFWAGLGQIYNGQIAKGIVLMIVQVINVLLMFVLIGFLTYPLVWLLGIVDAYGTAQKHNEWLFKGEFR